MADDVHDQSQKTEEPTQKRLDDAREKGQVASSREVGHWFALAAGAVAIGAAGPGAAADIAAGLARFLEQPHAIALSIDGAGRDMGGVVLEVALALLLPVLLFVGAALLGGFVQHGPILSAQPLQPDLERLSLVKGLQRLFSVRSLMEFAKGIAKLAVVGTVATLVVMPKLPRIVDSVQLGPEGTLRLAWELADDVMIAVVAVMAAVAGVDFLFQRLQHWRQLKMTRQEVKDEFKQTEGDPTIKARLRQLRMERARRRMMAAVPTADVVVTNPTHYAVALKYELGQMPAPKVVAKGADRIALRIREIAAENKVPVVENPPLARTLYAAVEVESYVPEAHYKAVAEVIGYVMRLKGKLPARPARRRAPA